MEGTLLTSPITAFCKNVPPPPPLYFLLVFVFSLKFMHNLVRNLFSVCIKDVKSNQVPHTARYVKA